MKPGELREKTNEELVKLSHELEEELFRLRFRKGMAQMKETSDLGKKRRDVARVRTILRERKAQK